MSDRRGPCVTHVPPKTAQKQGALLVRIHFKDGHDKDKTLKRIEPYDVDEVGVRPHLCGHFSDLRRPCLIQLIFVIWPRAKQPDRLKDDAAPGPQLCSLLENGI